MKKVIVFYFLFLTIFSLSASCCFKENLNEKAVLWKITGNNLEYPIHIFGTFHAVPEASFVVPDQLEVILKSSELIFLEVDVSNPDFVNQLRKSIVMEGKTIKDLATEEQYKILSGFFLDSLSTPLDALGMLKPWVLASMLIPKIIKSQLVSYDYYILEKAKEFNIPVKGIETVQEQIGYFDQVSHETQLEMLLGTIKDFNKQSDIYNQLLQLYLHGEVDQLYEFNADNLKEFKDFQRLVIDSRTENMAKRIPGYAGNQKSFFAVGFNHLGGKNGILQLLRNQGYIVEPVQ